MYFVTDEPYIEPIDAFTQFPGDPDIAEETITYELINADTGEPLPDFITINEFNEIVVETSNPEDVGIFNVKIIGTLGQYTELTDDEVFTISVIYLDNQIGPIPRLVYLLQDPEQFVEYPSLEYYPTLADGGPDLSFTYTIEMADGSEVPSWARFEPTENKIYVETDAGEIKIHEFNLRVTVNDYPEGFSVTVPFEIELISEPILVTQVPWIEYTIGCNDLETEFECWGLYPPTLPYIFDYTLENTDGTPLTVDWITVETATCEIVIELEDELQTGIYEFSLRGTLNDPRSSTDKVDFTVVMIDIDPVEQTDTIVYLLGSDNTYTDPIEIFLQDPLDPDQENPTVPPNYYISYEVRLNSGDDLYWLNVDDDKNYYIPSNHGLTEDMAGTYFGTLRGILDS